MLVLFACKEDRKLPTVSTASVTDITLNTASGGGIVTNEGGSPVIFRGVCWSPDPAPTVTDDKTTDASGAGAFTSKIIALKPDTEYHVRAYATNAEGTAYGPEVIFSTPLSPIPTNGLIAWWPFNGNAKDESGNGNDGTVNGPILDTDRNGTKNTCYRLDGKDDNIHIDKSFFDNGWPQFTINVWYYLEQQSNPSNEHFVHTLFNTEPHNGLDLNMNWGSSNNYAIFLGTGSPSPTWNIFFNNRSNATISIKQWRMVTLVKVENDFSLFIDGQLDTKWVSGTQVARYFYKAYLGAIDPAFSKEVIIGKIDDVSIHNRALTADEILKVFNGTGF